MKCGASKREIDLRLLGERFDISAELLSHIEGCESCRSYYRDSNGLRAALNVRNFEVFPGDLDSISFERLTANPRARQMEAGIFRRYFAGLLKWSWAPAAAAVVILALILLPGHSGLQIDMEQAAVQETLDWVEIYDAAENTDAWPKIAGSLESFGDEFSLAADELSSHIDIDDVLGSLTDDELSDLYDKIDKMNGST